MNRREFIESVVMATVAAGCRSPFGTSRLGRKVTPNYWCTWDTQDFLHERVGIEIVRDVVNEEQLFGKEGWVKLYPECRRFLHLVIDAGFDTGYGLAKDRYKILFGSLVPHPEKFPSFSGTPVQRLRELVKRIADAGWMGTGVWVPCQGTAELIDAYPDDPRVREQLKRKLDLCAEAGVRYWKVDWGTHNWSVAFRRLMTEVKNEICPDILLDHCCGFDNAMNGVSKPWIAKEYDKDYTDVTGTSKRLIGDPQFDWVRRDTAALMEFSDTFRIYDTTDPMVTASALERIVFTLLAGDSVNSRTLVNAQDECEIGACLGTAIGLMRASNWPPTKVLNPRQRHLMTTGAVRTILWQQVAPAFSTAEGGRTLHSEETISETWHFEKGSTWWPEVFDKTIEQKAPAVVSRGMQLPTVRRRGGDAPFVLVSRNPNGALTVGALARLDVGKGYHTPTVDIDLPDDVALAHEGTLGVIGRPGSLSVRATAGRVLAADMAGGEIADVTARCRFADGRLTIPGDVVVEIGSRMNVPGDQSEPGVRIDLVESGRRG